MARPLPFLLATGGVALAALGGAARAAACGSNGYSYAGLGIAQPAFGISATVTSVQTFSVLHGHVAGWVGVGGPHEGPGGTNEWLQVGLSGFPGVTGNDLYYEVAVPGHFPVYHQVAAGLPAGRPVRVGVLEIRNRPDWWRVWLNGRVVSKPIRLPDSYARWTPIATAESWDGGTGGACNTFLFHFSRVQVARSLGGGWRSVSSGFPIKSSTTRLHRARLGGAFLAAEGQPALRLLLSLTP
jgi:hypothetical protein